MMSKEQLEKIKEHFAYCMDEGLLFADQEEKLLEKLYEQAERAEELEDRHYRQELIDEHIERLEQQNKIYRKYLEKIADVENGFDPLAVEARMAIEEVGALESDCIHCNGKGFNGLDWCTQCNQGEVLE